MLKPKNSKLLAKIKELALYNKDYEMIKKIELIKNDDEITEKIKNYSIKR